MQAIILPKYEQLFCDSPKTILEYVRCMGRRMTLTLCTHFMYKELQDDQQNIIKFWSKYFSHDNEKFKHSIVLIYLWLPKVVC